MSRMRRAFERQFHAQLAKIGARRPTEGVEWLMRKAARWEKARGCSPVESMAMACERLGRQAGKRRQAFAKDQPPAFLCDGGLGGLARWLRAAGYQAEWAPAADDDALIERAMSGNWVLLTTDGALLERRAFTSGQVQLVWLPPTLGIAHQLRLVFSLLSLGLREPRCMPCGERLVRVDKHSVRDRIPPRTWKWLDEYYLCTGCGALFWRGTHWKRILAELEELDRTMRHERAAYERGSGSE